MSKKLAYETITQSRGATHTKEVITVGALKNPATMVPYTALAFLAFRSLERTCAAMNRQAFPTMADPSFTKIADGTHHLQTWKGRKYLKQICTRCLLLYYCMLGSSSRSHYASARFYTVPEDKLTV